METKYKDSSAHFDFLPENTISARKVSGDTIAEAYKAANGIY